MVVLIQLWPKCNGGDVLTPNNIPKHREIEPNALSLYNAAERQDPFAKQPRQEPTLENTQPSMSQPSELSTTGAGIQDELDLPLDPRTELKHVEAILRVPIHPWHKERVENIRGETIKQTIENLANYDDRLFATTTLGDTGFTPGDQRCEVNHVVHLFRVRRLLEDGRRNPQEVIPLLRAAYKNALSVWPEVRAERIAVWKPSRSEPDAFDKVAAKAVAATYLLAELEDQDSLPLLVQGYKLQCKWMNETEPSYITPVPAPTPMTLYAIHRLVSTLPMEQMNPQARKAHQSYMEWAQNNISPPEVFDGTAWHSNYDESDPYRRIADPEGEILKYEPRIKLVKYPFTFTDGTLFQPHGAIKGMKRSEREKEWAELLLNLSSTLAF